MNTYRTGLPASSVGLFAPVKATLPPGNVFMVIVFPASRLFASYTFRCSAAHARIMGATRRLEKSSANASVGWINSIGPGSTSMPRPIMLSSNSVLPT